MLASDRSRRDRAEEQGKFLREFLIFPLHTRAALYATRTPHAHPCPETWFPLACGNRMRCFLPKVTQGKHKALLRFQRKPKRKCWPLNQSLIALKLMAQGLKIDNN